MKHQEIEIDRQLETSVTVENEIQLRLRSILDYWGPNGEKYASGFLECRNGARCVWGQLSVLHGRSAFRPSPAFEEMKYLSNAARELGFERAELGDYHYVSNSVMCNNSGFSNARGMVERAIELAAS